jgi:hypothetical protein
VEVYGLLHIECRTEGLYVRLKLLLLVRPHPDTRFLHLAFQLKWCHGWLSSMASGVGCAESNSRIFIELGSCFGGLSWLPAAVPCLPCHLLAIWGWRGIAGRRASCPAASRKHDRDDDNDERVSGRPGIASASRRERQLGPHECVEWYPIATPPGPDPDRGFEQVGFPYAIAVSAPPFLRARTGSHGSRVRARRHLLRARPDEGRDSAPWRAVVPGSRPVATMATTRAASAIIIVISAVLITTIEGGVGGRPAG